MTVAASFSTPVLFTIAQDLSKMEVDLAVGEPDIGSVKVGEPVDFTVLAYPNTTFTGTVSQVRQNPTVVSNVVTYDTVVIVNNNDGLLRPGMTANAMIQTQNVANALIVPLQALEYRPSADLTARYHCRARPATRRRIRSGAGTVGHRDGLAVRRDDGRRRDGAAVGIARARLRPTRRHAGRASRCRSC